MKTFSTTLPTGEAIHYVDRKRWLWLLSVLFPLQVFVPLWLHVSTGNEAWFLIVPLANFGLLPILDWIVGEDRNNPPEEIIKQLEQDPYYRNLTLAIVPVHIVALLACVWYAGTQDLSWAAFLGLGAIGGLAAGLAINTGHELGHKNSKLEKNLSKVVLAIPAYGHFSIDHNRGHHRDVSTPGDSSSARMGESIYKFGSRDIPGAFRRAWQIEKERLENRGHSVWHHDNGVLQSHAASLAIAAVLVVSFGWKMIPFLLVHHWFAYWQLTAANYVEHYGLLRLKDEDGRYERCQPHHSWNSNHVVSNLALFHLERHSDHHAHPLRRYQSLRHFENLPQLPNGYFGVYVLAYMPWLWFRVMDVRLLALPHIQGDLNKVNVCPEANSAIFLKYGRDKMVEPTIDRS